MIIRKIYIKRELLMLILISTIVLMAIISFIDETIEERSKLTSEDRLEIINVTTSYYRAIEQNDFSGILDSFRDIHHDKLLENHDVYENINEELQYKLKFNYIVQNSLKQIDKNKARIMASVQIDYTDSNLGYIVESLRLYKKDGRWFIEEIESYDKHIWLRSVKYKIHG